MEILVLIIIICFALIAWAIGSSISETKERERRLKALQLSDVDNMSGIEFEHYVAKLLNHKGYRTQVTKGSGDLGVDIVAQNAETKYAIQVKRYSKNVSRRAVSDAVAGMSHWKCNASMVITNSYFTSGALQLAQSTKCVLVNRDELAQWIINFQENNTNSNRGKGPCQQKATS